MNCAKLILSITLMIGSAKAVASTRSSADQDGYARGLMVVVDTRDQQACQDTKEHLQILTSLTGDLCAQNELNPLSVVVLTIPIKEWDFQMEIESSRNAPKTVRDVNVGFVRGGRTGLLFLLPSARESDNSMRLAVRKAELSVAQVRLSDMALLRSTHGNTVFTHFVLKKMSPDFDAKERSLVARMIKRVKVTQQSPDSSKSETAISSLGIVDGINSSLQEVTNSDRFELDFFLPDLDCGNSRKCNFDDGFFIPLGFGLTFKMQF